MIYRFFFFFSSRRRHTRWTGDWSSDVCSSDLLGRNSCSGLLQIQKKNAAVGVVGLSGSSLSLEDGTHAVDIFLAADRGALRQVAANEVALVVDLRIDAMIDQSAVLGDLDGNVMRGGAD